MDTVDVLAIAVVILLTYCISRWYQNPLRPIPGPIGYPLIGNILSLKPESMHVQLYDIAREYGAVTKVYILGTPLVTLNNIDVCLETLLKKGTDFQGRPPLPRIRELIPKDLVFSSVNDPIHQPLRRMLTKAMKAYGPGVGHLEDIIQEIVLDLVDGIQAKEGEAIDTHELCTGYVSCVLVSVLFGEKHIYSDPICQSFHQINEEILAAVDPVSPGAVFDLFPALLNFGFILGSYQRQLRRTVIKCREFFQGKIDEAKDTFNKYEIKGCVDYMIQTQQQEFDENDKPIIDDEALRGVLVNFVVAGTETSLSTLSQIFLDLLHNPDIVKKLQSQIDERFEPTQSITFSDREKLPYLEAFLLENQRNLSVLPLLIPYMTLRDTEVAGYKIPAHTRVLMNSFYTSHDPDVYEDPFTFKLERFLDEEGNLVPISHPARANLLSFGMGRRQCPGEMLAKSRTFLFLANILQKFDIDAVGELPDHDVKGYRLSTILTPPMVKARFIRRQQ